MGVRKQISEDWVFEVNEYVKKPWWFPRRWDVVTVDLLLVLQAIYVKSLVAGYADWYCIVVMMMFGVSAFHHWVPYKRWHHRLDRATIYLLIAGTVLPYVEHVTELGKGFAFGLLAIAALGGVLLKLCNIAMQKGGLASGLYLTVGLGSVYCMIGVGQYFDWLWWLMFWGGVIGYAISMYTYNHDWPNQRWYRAAQHLIMLPVVTVHLWLPVVYFS